MNRLVPLAFVVLIVCSLPAFGTAGPVGPEPVASEEDQRTTFAEGTVEWLALADGPATSGDGYVAIDVGATLADDATQLDSRYEEYRLDARLGSAGSDTERQEVVRDEVDRLSESVTQLRERERTAYTEYYRGERTERELLADLAVIHTEATTLGEAVATLENHVTATDGDSLDAELEAMEVETLTMQGPVREHVADVVRGEEAPTRVYVEADGDGVVLALTDGGQFDREAHRLDNRDPSGDAEYASLSQSEDRIAELYPSVFPDARWSYSEIGYGTHRGVGNHDQGTLTVYLDTATGDVYREDQRLQLDRTETATVDRETNESVEMTISQTVPGGPASVQLADAETSAPLSGSVELDDRPLGETDDDGVVWFVAPRDSVTITATVDGTSVEAEIAEDSVGQGTAHTPADDESS